MNWDIVEGNWTQLKGKVKEKFGKLTDSDIQTLSGKKDQFLGLLQQRYGYTREQAEREAEEWARTRERPMVARR